MLESEQNESQILYSNPDEIVFRGGAISIHFHHPVMGQLSYQGKRKTIRRHTNREQTVKEMDFEYGDLL